ncbi:unknown [Cercopithecine alphaherpesvirus 9]|uniref:Uncharacterized protein n=1 Tax=Cercopithecine herpesvirus 9 (strain DHV) TaxID=36348 RepID=Q9E1W4_CHV9D|nr:nuclear protein UL4 [Cercopithecine alphaherpesvirus 9]AAG27231.1 unknown [Cercopithecine alphaherpesvirus 9]
MAYWCSPLTSINYRLCDIENKLDVRIPKCNQALYAYNSGVRSVVIKEKTRCDSLNVGTFILQHTPNVTVLTLDGMTDFASYTFFTRKKSYTQTQLQTNTLVVPFENWTVQDLYLRACNNNKGLLSVTLGYDLSLSISIIIYESVYTKLTSNTSPVQLPQEPRLRQDIGVYLYPNDVLSSILHKSLIT